MEQLKEQISQDLIAYQRKVDFQLREFYNRGLLSKNDIEEFKLDAQLTGKAVLEAFDSEKSYPESVLKVYVNNLFEKYKIEIEAKISSIKRRRVTATKDEIEVIQKKQPQKNRSRQQSFLGKFSDGLKEIYQKIIVR